MNKIIALILGCTLLGIFFSPVSAQTPEIPPGPVYIVQEGDTLWEIAYLFQVSVDDIVTYNNLTGLNIFIGDRLVIPGLDFLSGILSVQPVPFGENLRSLSRQNNLDIPTLVELNKIVTPSELFVGYEMILLQNGDSPQPSGRDTLLLSDNILDLAVRQNINIWEISQANKISDPILAIPGDTFSISNGKISSAPVGFPTAISKVTIDPLPISQGDTVQVLLNTSSDVTPGGFLGQYEFHFFPQADGSWVALQGIYAMEEPGIYPLQISTISSEGFSQAFEQMILIRPGYFLDESLYVDPSLIDTEITEPEYQWLLSIIAPVSPEKLWKDVFSLPVAEPYCLNSGFGNRRSYNAGELLSFHSGLDFGICSQSHPYDIYAPADGRVVFVGEKTVRGNTTIIDHGWGVFSGFWHQDEIFVKIGDDITAGQLIGTIGSTGRVDGPHLHWELWVNGVQVNPFPWLEDEFPHEK